LYFFLYSFRFRFFFHFDIFPCKFSARCTPLASRSARWLRYWCAEIMNYETVPAALSRHSLYMHIDEMPSIFFFIYARPIPRIIHDAPRFPRQYMIWSPTPAMGCLWYTYIIFVVVVARSSPSLVKGLRKTEIHFGSRLFVVDDV